MTQEVQPLADLWLEAKRRETEAREERVTIEASILAILGCKPEGAQTHKVGRLAIVTEGRLSYTCPDVERLAALAPDLTKRALHETAVKALRTTDPDAYAYLAKMDLIGVKPMKPGVTIKVKDEE